MTIAFYNKEFISGTEISQQILDLTAMLIEKIIDIVRANNLLDLPYHIDVVLSSSLPIGVAARADVNKALIEIDPSQTPRSLLDSIIHELIHLEQSMNGWLKGSIDPIGMIWFGKFFNVPDTDEEYRAAPWERDAWRRTPEVIKEYKRCLKDSVETNAVSSAKKPIH